MLGLPGAALGEQSRLPNVLSSSLINDSDVPFYHLIGLPPRISSANFNHDYWHQHNIRKAIRHLSFMLTSARLSNPQQYLPLLIVQYCALLNTLQTLLQHTSSFPVMVCNTSCSMQIVFMRHKSRLWLSQVNGIRAGPV